MTVQILQGDCREILRTLPAESVDCVVTSPPYWGLRDYGVAGQLGLEPTLGEHIATMVDVFREVRRVLKKTGTVWLNYGDCYATSPNGWSAAQYKEAGTDDRTHRDKPFSTIGPIYDPTGGPKGGGFRGDNLGRTETDKDAVPKGRICAGGYLKAKDLCMVPNRIAIALQEAGWWVRSEIIWAKANPMPESIRDRPTTSHEKIWLLTKSAKYFYDAEAVKEQGVVPAGTLGAKGSAERAAMPGVNSRPPEYKVYDGQRNLRNVWSINTAPFPEAHFATFPPELAERCVKAGCPADGVVLDPFGGAGTTGLVADRLQRDCILIELSAEYVDMARARIDSDRGGLLDAMETPAPGAAADEHPANRNAPGRRALLGTAENAESRPAGDPASAGRMGCDNGRELIKGVGGHEAPQAQGRDTALPFQ